MTTTLQQIKDRAIAFSTANTLPSLTADSAELINRIGADERQLFDLAAEENSYYYATTASAASSAGASARTVALTAVNPTTAPVARLLKVVLPSGTEVNPVDLRDVDAELAPRYQLIGTTLTEVSNDWSAVSGAVTLTLTYMKRPAPFSLSGALTQTISLPDEFADLLELKLALYLAHKDVGRPVDEIERLGKDIEKRTNDYLGFLRSYAGPEARRFALPAKSTKR